jgi:hypothetical protein
MSSQLLVAVGNQDEDVVKMLLAAGNAGVDLQAALALAVQNQDEDVVKVLLEAGNDVVDL